MKQRRHPPVDLKTVRYHLTKLQPLKRKLSEDIINHLRKSGVKSMYQVRIDMRLPNGPFYRTVQALAKIRVIKKYGTKNSRRIEVDNDKLYEYMRFLHSPYSQQK